MMAGEKRRLHNPFVSTLQQRSLTHQRMAALMRIGTFLPPTPGMNIPQTDLPIATGTLQMRQDDLPMGWMVPLSRIQAAAAAPAIPSVNQSPRSAQDPLQITPVQQPGSTHQEPAQVFPSPVQNPSVPSAIKTPSSQPIEAGSLEDAWPRLEAIFERHEESQQQSHEVENNLPTEEEFTAPDTSSFEEGMNESEMNIARLSNEAEQIQSTSPQSHRPQAVVQKQVTDDQTPEMQPEVEKAEQLKEKPQEVEKNNPIKEGSTFIDKANSFNQSGELKEAHQQPGPLKVKPANELSFEEDATQEKNTSEVTDVEEEESEVEQILEQPVPLNAVWPVEQRAVNLDDDSSNTPTLTVSNQNILQEPSIQAEQFDQAEKTVHAALENVPGEHFSRSGIEVITPRHSRPVIQRQSAQIEEASEEEQMLNGEIFSDSHGKASLPYSQPDVVETDIGPLPVDLWELLGQSLPSKTSEPISHPKTTGMQSEEKSVHLEETLASAEKYTPPPENTSPPASQQQSIIQRSEVSRPSAIPEPPQRVAPPSQNSVQRSAQPNSADSPDANQGGQESEEEKKGFDLESLSRKVYAEIKRRFQREHERDR